MIVPAAAAWIGVPVTTAMSMPSWCVPHRAPNGDVIGPLTGQLSVTPVRRGGLVVTGAFVVGAWVTGAWAGLRAGVVGAGLVVVGAGAAASSPPAADAAGGAGVARSRMICASCASWAL